MEDVADIIDELVAQLNAASTELDGVTRKIVDAANAFEHQEK